MSVKSTDITCPHCGFIEEPCFFPDLYETGLRESHEWHGQSVLMEKIQNWGFNVVTCGQCGFVILHEMEVT